MRHALHAVKVKWLLCYLDARTIFLCLISCLTARLIFQVTSDLLDPHSLEDEQAC
jgi:hypothetical protein